MGAILRVIVALMSVPILVATFYEGRKVYWDYRVQEMCANDGGVTIVEPVSISTMQEKLLPHVGGVVAVTDRYQRCTHPV